MNFKNLSGFAIAQPPPLSGEAFFFSPSAVPQKRAGMLLHAGQTRLCRGARLKPARKAGGSPPRRFAASNVQGTSMRAPGGLQSTAGVGASLIKDVGLKEPSRTQQAVRFPCCSIPPESRFYNEKDRRKDYSSVASASSSSSAKKISMKRS